MIYTILLTIVINLLYEILSIRKLRKKDLCMTNSFCKRISKIEYNFQTNNQTNCALKNLKAYYVDEMQRDPIYFASNILNKIKKENRYINFILKL